MRIAVISPYSHYAGHHWAYAERLTGELARRGLEVDVFVAGDPINVPTACEHRKVIVTFPYLRRIAANYRRLLQKPKLLSFFHNWETFCCTLCALVRNLWRRYDAIHFTDGTYLLVMLSALLTRRAVVYSIWGNFAAGVPAAFATGGAKQRLRGWLLNKALNTGRFALICETSSIQERWNRFLLGNLHVIPYAITEQSASITRAEARTQLKLPPDAPVLLLFGTHRAGKNYQIVFDAVTNLPQPVWLLFAGSVISVFSPTELAEKCKFDRYVSIERFVKDEEIPLFFAASDAAILPYANGFDRGSGVLLDACQYGIPVITSRTGYLEAFIRQHGTGFLFEPDNAIALQGAIKTFLAASPEERQSLKERIHQTAHEHSWLALGNKFLEIYEDYSAPSF